MVPGCEGRIIIGVFYAPSRPHPGGPCAVALGVFIVGTIAGYPAADMEAVMTEQAVMEPTTAIAEPEDQNLVAADDEALIAEELLVEEVSIDGMCGVY
jgi:mycofactocin precursor